VLLAKYVAADGLDVTQRKTITNVVLPGRLLNYMAAARTILAAVSADSETVRSISEPEVGLVLPPEEPAALG
jgi:hypothetical protein